MTDLEPSAPSPASYSDTPPRPPPAPFAVHYSAWKVGAIALLIACASAAWAWRGAVALMAASPKTFHLWLTPALGAFLTAAILAGIVALFRGRTEVVRIDEAGLTVPDLYEDRLPWPAIGGVTVVRGRGVVVEVRGGAGYGRRITRNLRAGSTPGAVDMACIRSGLLAQPAGAILARLLAHQGHAQGLRDAR